MNKEITKSIKCDCGTDDCHAIKGNLLDITLDPKGGFIIFANHFKGEIRGSKIEQHGLAVIKSHKIDEIITILKEFKEKLQ